MTILTNLLEFNATYNKQLLRFMFQFCIKSLFCHLSYKERTEHDLAQGSSSLVVFSHMRVLAGCSLSKGRTRCNNVLNKHCNNPLVLPKQEQHSLKCSSGSSGGTYGGNRYSGVSSKSSS